MPVSSPTKRAKPVGAMLSVRLERNVQGVASEKRLPQCGVPPSDLIQAAVVSAWLPDLPSEHGGRVPRRRQSLRGEAQERLFFKECLMKLLVTGCGGLICSGV